MGCIDLVITEPNSSLDWVSVSDKPRFTCSLQFYDILPKFCGMIHS